MDKEMYKDIRGIEKFFEHFPDKPWHYFHEIIEFRWYREFDYEEWYNRFYINLVMSDREGKDIHALSYDSLKLELVMMDIKGRENK